MPLAARAGRRYHVATESRDFKGGVGLKGTSVKGANGIMNPRYPPSGKADQMGDNANLSGRFTKQQHWKEALDVTTVQTASLY